MIAFGTIPIVLFFFFLLHSPRVLIPVSLADFGVSEFQGVAAFYCAVPVCHEPLKLVVTTRFVPASKESPGLCVFPRNDDIEL